ncbi:unnamed protein product [Clonostachys rosea]|uniref:F-box domain-containing protein n=1 Tax=Bionectria ochroleuca TaxID=29856 RepID=A0ABY6U5A4_BIOOC|nr:unnamed protein product [Clonostachys rosea]
MVHLPAEIIDKILTHLIENHLWKYFPWAGKVLSWHPPLLWSDLTCTDQSAVHGHGTRLHESIYSLRLVSREWNCGIAPLLAKYTTWNIHLDSDQSTQSALACLENRSDHLPPTRELVRRLRIEPGKICLRDEASSGTTNDYKTAGTYLYGLLSGLDRVESLDLSFLAVYKNNYDVEKTNKLVEAIRHGLTETNVLRRVADIQLKVPTTYHAGRILGAISGDRQTQLSRLLVKIEDSSGVAGDRHYLETNFMDTDERDGTIEESDDEDDERVAWNRENFPRSDLQLRYPNRRNQKELWDFVFSCPNLEALSIASTHYLNLHEIVRERRPSFQGLRVLHLGRVYAASSSIIPLLQPAENAPAPRLQRLVLNDVKAPDDGGLWGELAGDLLTDAPDLDLAFFWNLSYFDFCEQGAGLSSPADSTVIDSSDDGDLEPIQALARKLARMHGDKDSWPFWLRETVDEILYSDDEFCE